MAGRRSPCDDSPFEGNTAVTRPLQDTPARANSRMPGAGLLKRKCETRPALTGGAFPYCVLNDHDPFVMPGVQRISPSLRRWTIAGVQPGGGAQGRLDSLPATLHISSSLSIMTE